MARPLRLEFAGLPHHVASRGDRREAIYEDGEDRVAFLNVLASVARRFGWLVHAYCLKGNRYHLLIETPDGNLAHGMRYSTSVYPAHTARFDLICRGFIGQVRQPRGLYTRQAFNKSTHSLKCGHETNDVCIA